MKRTYYYEKSTITENIISFINDREGAVSFATVNEDGSPNISVMIPQMTDDEKYLFVWMGESFTRTNLLERKKAMVLFYKYDKNGEDKFTRNIGLRLSVVLDETEGLHEKYGVNSKALMLKVVEVIPLG